jgi:uncharacterized protein (TIGR02246 family)
MSNADDYEAIRRLLAEYCHCYDDGRADDYAALFTEDAEFVVMGRTYEGRSAIGESIGAHKPDQPAGQHVTYNEVIDLDPSGIAARVRTDFLYLKRDGDRLSISTAGRYHDVVVREPDRWRFRRREITFLGDA